MEKNPLSKEELIKQLKAIAKKKTILPTLPTMGVMCYSIAEPKEIIFKCEHCGKMYHISSLFWEGDSIGKRVGEIRNLGYDAEVGAVCSKCAIKLGLIDENDSTSMDRKIHWLFKFKARGQEKWHLAISNDPFDYDALIAFLKNEPTYITHMSTYRSGYGFCDEPHFTKAKLGIIMQLTGIDFEEL